MKHNSPITTHVLDVSVGKPAAGVKYHLEFLKSTNWEKIGDGTTNQDGRVDGFCPTPIEKGRYRITFETKEYYEKKGQKCFYPSVLIQFEITETMEHYHVPLLMSPFGYSTYRGS